MNKIDLEALFMNANVKPKAKFYSTVYGDVYFDGFERWSDMCILTFTKYLNSSLLLSGPCIKYNTNGVLSGSEYEFGEMTLFPSKEIRDWYKWEELKCYQGDVSVGDYVVGLTGDGTIKNMFQKVFKVLDVTDTHFNCVCVCGKDDVDKTIEIRKDCVKKHDFIPNVYTEGMPVLVRNYGVEDVWLVDIFHSYCCNGTYMCGKTSKDRRVYSQCIPYNSETYKLVLTNNDCPQFYKRW